jgi:hypothetical protein
MRPPDVEGPAAKAWVFHPEPRDAAQVAALATWVVHSPHFHPFWSWWFVSVVHLRPIPGTPMPRLHYPEAGFEFMIASINPEESDPNVDDPGPGFHLLEPFDVIEQFHGVSDADARSIALAAIRCICDGKISPDQDNRRLWKHLIAGTVAHYRDGAHPQE